MLSYRIFAGVFVLTACSSASRNPSGEITGAVAPRIAVEQFLSGAKARDIQVMGTVFGTNKGPARETMDRTELEKRLVILSCYFNHDSNRILGEVGGADGHRDVRVELRKGNMTRQPTFYVIQGPGQRWYVDNMEISAVRDFCGNQDAPTPPPKTQ